jgi:membrane protein
MNPKKIFGIIKKSASGWSEDKASTMAASLSYYTIFSIAPLLIIAVAVAGMVFGQEAARGEIHSQISGLVGESGAKTIESMMAATSKKSDGILASIIGLAALIFGASGVFVQLQDSLNVIWKVKPDKTSGIFAFLRHRLLSFSLVFAIGFVLLVSLGVSAGIAALGAYATSVFPGFEALMHVAEILVSFGIITALFAVIYKFLPDADIRWADVWLGAAVTSALFALGKFAIGLYLGKSGAASAYGAAGSVAIVLVWVYYAAQILYFGAEFTRVYSEEHGMRAERNGKVAPQPPKEKKSFFDRFRKHPKHEEVAATTAPVKPDAEVPPNQWLPH